MPDLAAILARLHRPPESDRAGVGMTAHVQLAKFEGDPPAADEKAPTEVIDIWIVNGQRVAAPTPGETPKE